MPTLTISTRCKFLIKLAAFFILIATPLEAAPKRYYEDPSNVALREMRATLDDLRHEISNHETEIKTYDEKLHNLETIIDSLRQQSTDVAQGHKEALKDSSATLEMKINSLETTTKGLVADLKQFKNHANETASAISQYKQKLTDLEKVLEIQNQNIESLQTAIRSLTDVLQVNNNLSVSSTGKIYRVASGDSLEKIARKHSTTIQAIKDLNGLTHDRIIVGQTLKMP